MPDRTNVNEIKRDWGSYIILEEDPNYRIKRISVNPGQKLSLHMHYNRNEHWIIVHGTAEVELDGKNTLLMRGDGILVPKTSKHRLGNPGKMLLDVIEIEIGEYLGEDDIVRFD